MLWVAAAVAIWLPRSFVAPAHPDEKTAASVWSQVRELSRSTPARTSGVLRHWRDEPGDVSGDTRLWAGPWFRDLGRDDVAAHLLYITIAMVIGFSVGVVMERLGVGISNLAVASTYCPLRYLPWWSSCLGGNCRRYCLAGVRLFSGAGFLFYPLLCGYFKEELAGRVVTSANVLTFIGAFVAQWAISAVINRWPVIENGNFHPAGYPGGLRLFGGMTPLAHLGHSCTGTKRSTRAAS